MILSTVPVHKGDLFNWRNVGAFCGLGVTDASDLGSDFAKRVYDDACDVGFFIESHQTGRRMLFTHAFNEIQDGEVVYQVFKSTGPSDKIEIHVYND